MYKIKAVLYAGVIVLLNWPCKDGAIKEKLGDCFFFFSQGAATLKKVEALPKGNIRFVQGWQYCTISKGVKTPCH